MDLDRNKRLHSDPELLGLFVDSKLTFIPIIKMLKALNILKCVSSTNWGEDSTVLLNLHK